MRARNLGWGWRVTAVGLLPMVAVVALSCESGSSSSDLGPASPDLSSREDAATVEPVVLGAVAPSSGGTAGGTTIALTGSGFRSGSLVRVGGTMASSIQVSPSGTTITCNTPARLGKPGPVDVVVESPSGSSSTASQAFRYFLSSLAYDAPSSVAGTDSGPRSVGVADLNKDGSPDLVVVYQTSSTVHSYKNSGTGSFSLSVNRSVGSAPVGLVIADLDGNGNLDVTTTSQGASVVSVLLGDGAGSLAPAVNSSTGGGSQPVSLVAVDANNDGSLDLLTANAAAAAGSNLGLLLGNKTASFALGTPLGTSAAVLVGLTAADLDGNGKVDVAAIHRLNQLGVTNVSVLQNRGGATAPLLSLGGAKTNQVNPNAVGSGDFNRDGLVDVVVTNDVTPLGKLTLLSGVSGGQLADASAASTNDLDGTPTGLAVADLDGDGNLDVIVTNTSGVSGNLSLLRGLGNGKLAASQRIDFPGVTRPSAVAVGDFDRDGIADLVITDQPTVGAGAVLIRRGIGM